MAGESLEAGRDWKKDPAFPCNLPSLAETIYFFHKSMKFFWVLFEGSLGTEFHPHFFLLAWPSCSLQRFGRGR